MKDVRIEVLGGLQLFVGGELRPLPIRKAQLLLARIALAPRWSVGRDVLSALLWETSDEERARISLRQAVAQVRRALDGAAEVLVTDGDRLALDASRVVVDVKELEAGGSSDTLVAGELLEGLRTRDPGVEDWLAAERHRVRQLQVDSCERGASEALADGDMARAAALASRGLALDPLRESLHRTAMRAFSARGDRALALQQFRSCRDILERELRARPEPATVRLYDEIRAARQAPQPEPQPLPAEAAQGEIRQIAVLCAAPAPDDDPELQLAALERLRGHAAEVAERFGGSPITSDGSEVVLAFGLSRSHEAEGARARAAAEALLTTDSGLRLGCASGRVVVHRGPPLTVSGEARGRAAAMMATARPGVIELGRELQDEARPEPVFVGRMAELAQLRSLLPAVVGGSGAVAIVSGEPGIGKTRLVAAFAAEAERAGGVCLRLSFEAFGRKTRVIETLAAAAHQAGGAVAETTGGAKALAGRLLGTGMPPGGESLLNAMSAQRKIDLGLDLVGQLLVTVPQRPVMILIEDAHWAEPAQVEVLLRLLGLLERIPALVVATERRAEAQFLPAIRRQLSTVPTLAIELGPFTAADGASLARALGVDDDARVAEALKRTHGNPLFLARLLGAAPGERERLPASVVALVQEQMDRVGEEALLTLRQAAILGQSFVPRDHADAFGPGDFGALVAAGFLGRDRDRLAFMHALVHEAVYASITRADRRRMHARLAELYRGRDVERWADHALAADGEDAAAACAAAADLLLPRHEFAEGADYIASGLAIARTEADRAPLLIARGSLERELGQLDQALEDYRAANSPGAAPDVRAQALVRQAWVHRLEGRFAEAERALGAAEALAAEVTQPTRAEIESQLGALALARGDHALCRRHNERALALTDSPLQRSRALGGLGECLHGVGRMTSAAKTLDEAIALARNTGYGVVEIELAPISADAHRFSAPGMEALAHAEAARERSREAGNVRSEAAALFLIAELHWSAGDLDAALAAVAEAGEVLPESSEPAGERLAWLQSLCLVARGDADGATRLTDQALKDAVSPKGRCLLLGVHAWSLRDPARRRAVLSDGLAALARGGDGRTALWFHRLAIEACVDGQDWTTAETHAAALEEVTAEEPLAWSELVIRRARLLSQAGRGMAAHPEERAAGTLADDLEAAMERQLLPPLLRAFGL